MKESTKGSSFRKQCLHDIQFMKTRSSSPNLSKIVRADISNQFMKTRSLFRHCFHKLFTKRMDFNHKSGYCFSYCLRVIKNKSDKSERNGYALILISNFQTSETLASCNVLWFLSSSS